MIKAIIFDLWGTLATKNVPISKTLQEKFAIPKTEDFARRYEEDVQLNQWETEEEMAGGFLSKFGLGHKADSVGFIVDLFRRGINGATLFDGIPELLTTLKTNGYKLGLLSNTTVFEAVALNQLGIAKFFDAVLFSWQTGKLKPANEMFDQILAKLEVTKEESIFIDDNKQNIAAAQVYGIQAIRFESVPQITQELSHPFNL